MSIFESLSTNEGQAAFWGAFFAAAFSLLVFLLTRYVSGVIDRRRKHYDFLVRLETKLNQHINRSYMGIYIIEGVINTTKIGRISYNDIDTLQLPLVGDFHDLLDEDLLNQIFSYELHTESLNADTAAQGRVYSEMRNALFNNQTDFGQFFSRYPRLLDDLNILLISWQSHQKRTIELLAVVRLAIRRDKTQGIAIRHWLMSRKMNSFDKDDIKQEKKKLKGEIDKIGAKSKKQIDATLKQSK